MSNLVPRQWSIKLDSGEIYVVQSETTDDLETGIAEIKESFLQKDNPVVVRSADVSYPTATMPMVPTGSVCKVCGKPAERKKGINKNGNPYVLWKCAGNYKHNWFEN